MEVVGTRDGGKGRERMWVGEVKGGGLISCGDRDGKSTHSRWLRTCNTHHPAQIAAEF